mgnify:FL=1
MGYGQMDTNTLVKLLLQKQDSLTNKVVELCDELKTEHDRLLKLKTEHDMRVQSGANCSPVVLNMNRRQVLVAGAGGGTATGLLLVTVEIILRLLGN